MAQKHPQSLQSRASLRGVKALPLSRLGAHPTLPVYDIEKYWVGIDRKDTLSRPEGPTPGGVYIKESPTHVYTYVYAHASVYAHHLGSTDN